MKHRLLRVRELLKRELSDVLQRDYAFDNALVTVNDVDVTPDLRQAHAYLGIISPDPRRSEAILAQLNSDHGRIQKKVSARVVLKYTPQLHFKLDHSVERGVRIVSIMEGIEVPPDEDEVENADADDNADEVGGAGGTGTAGEP